VSGMVVVGAWLFLSPVPACPQNLLASIPRDDTFLETAWNEWQRWDKVSLTFRGQSRWFGSDTPRFESVTGDLQFHFGAVFGKGHTRFTVEAGLGRTQVWANGARSGEVAFGELRFAVHPFLTRGDVSPYVSLVDVSLRVSPYPPGDPCPFTLTVGVPFGIQARLRDALFRFDGVVAKVWQGMFALPAPPGEFSYHIADLDATQVTLDAKLCLASDAVRQAGLDALVLSAGIKALSVSGPQVADANTVDFDCVLTAVLTRHLGIGAGIVGTWHTGETDGESEDSGMVSVKVFGEYRCHTPSATFQIGVSTFLPWAKLEETADLTLFARIRVEIPR